MTFLGQAAITAPTRTTARALLVTAALLGMVRLGWVAVDGLTVFEATLAEGRAEAVLRWLVGFLIAAHAVQWVGDFLSYRAWNVLGAERARGRDIARRKYQSRLSAAVEDALHLVDAPTSGSEISVWSDDRRAHVREDLRTLSGSMARFSLYALFYVWLWYGALPVLAACAAIAWSLHG